MIADASRTACRAMAGDEALKASETFLIQPCCLFNAPV